MPSPLFSRRQCSLAGLQPRVSASPDEAGPYLRSERIAWGDVVRRSGVALERFDLPMGVTAISHRHSPVIASCIGPVAPSESSVIERVADEPLFLAHLKTTPGIRGVKRVPLQDPSSSLSIDATLKTAHAASGRCLENGAIGLLQQCNDVKAESNFRPLIDSLIDPLIDPLVARVGPPTHDLGAT